MDNGKGQFREITDEKFKEQMKLEEPRVFKVGEILEIRGSRLRIQKISQRRIIMKLLPKK